jgi:hypothetical protein
MAEKTASDAPVWYSAEAASGWANGYNVAVEELDREVEELRIMLRQAQRAIVRLAPYVQQGDADLNDTDFLQAVAQRITENVF